MSYLIDTEDGALRQRLAAANEGDTFELAPLAAGISPIPVMAACVTVKDDTRYFEFSWHGTFIARGRAFMADGAPRCTILD